MQDARFTGRSALVTGASRGIGRAISLLLAAGGARVAVNYRKSRSQAEETVRHITDSGGEAIAVEADVSQPEQVADMIRHVGEKLGPVELLVNNAGIFQPSTHADLSLDDWRANLDVNLTGVYLVTWAVKDGMLQRRFGRIVNVTSIAGLRARPRSIAYAAAKAGVISLTKSCAEAFAAKNVRVNAVAPGLIDTEIIADVDSAFRQKLIGDTPMGRIGQPDDIAKVVSYLLSEESSFLTGQTLVASGGRVLVP